MGQPCGNGAICICRPDCLQFLPAELPAPTAFSLHAWPDPHCREEEERKRRLEEERRQREEQERRER